MVLGNEKRAVSDEAVRDTLPTEELNVGNAPVLDKLSNMDVAPGTGSLFFNPDIFEPLARISEKVHDTRRGSRQKDYLGWDTDYLNDVRTVNYMETQQLKYDADKALIQYRGSTLARVEELMEQASRAGNPLTRVQALEIAMKEAQTLSDNNLSAGNYYIAERLNEFNSMVKEKMYPTAIVEDNRQAAEEVKMYSNLSSTRGAMNVAAGHTSLENGILLFADESIKSSTFLDSPTDQELCRNNIQKYYLAQLQKIKQDPNTSMDEKLGALRELRAYATPTGEVLNKKDYFDRLRKTRPEEDSTYNPILPYYISKGYIYSTRVASDLEKLQYEMAGQYNPETGIRYPSLKELEEKGFNFTTDGDGNLLISEIWDVSANEQTLQEIDQEMFKLSSITDVNESMDNIDYYKRKIGFDDLSKGKIFDNKYLKQASFSQVMSDFSNYKKWCMKLLADPNLKAQEKSKIISSLRETGQVLFSSAVIYTYTDALARQGYSASEIANKLIEVKEVLDNALNAREGDKFISSGELSKILGIEVNGVLQPFILDDETLSIIGRLDEFGAGMQRYAYAVELSKRLGPAIEQISVNPGMLNSMNASIGDMQSRFENSAAPSQLVYVDEAGTVSSSSDKVHQAQLNYQTYVGRTIKNNGVEAKNYAVMSAGNTMVTRAQQIQDPVRRQEYIKDTGLIIGQDLMLIGLPANMSKADKQVLEQAKIYQLLSKSQYASEYNEKIKRFNSGESAGLPPLTWSNANSSVKAGGAYGKIKITGGSGGTFTEQIDSIAKKYASVETLGTARELALQMVQANAANGSTEFSLKIYEDVLASNFKGGTYLHELQYDTTRLVDGSPNQMEQNSVQAFVDRQDEFNSYLNSSSSANKGATVARDANGIKVVKPNGNDLTLVNERGQEQKFYVYHDIAPGVDGTTALNTKKNILGYANNLATWTNKYHPSLYGPNGLAEQIKKTTGMSSDEIADTSLSLITTLSKKETQLYLQDFHAHPEKYSNFVDRKNPNRALYYAIANNGLPSQEGSTDVSKTVNMLGNDIDGISSMIGTKEKVKTKLVETDKAASQRADDLQFLDALRNNRNTIPTLNYNSNTVITGYVSKNIYQPGSTFYMPDGSTATYTHGPKELRIYTDIIDGKPVTHKRPHYGNDLLFKKQVKLAAMWSGKVTVVAYDSKAGHYIHWKDAQGNTYIYMHMAARPNYKVGDYIKYGDIVGLSGRTGNVTGLNPGETLLDFRIKDKNGKYVMDIANFKQQPQSIAPRDINTSVYNQVKGTWGQVKFNEIAYINKNANSMHTLTADFANIYGRKLNTYGGLWTTGDSATEDKVKSLTWAYGDLLYNVFKGSKNSRAYSMAALNPKVTFTYTTAMGPISSPELQKVNGLQLLKLYKSGKLKNITGGQWIPDNRSIFDAEVLKYNKHMEGK